MWGCTRYLSLVSVLCGVDHCQLSSCVEGDCCINSMTYFSVFMNTEKNTYPIKCTLILNIFLVSLVTLNSREGQHL